MYSKKALNTDIICFCFACWFLVVPLIVGCILLFKQLRENQVIEERLESTKSLEQLREEIDAANRKCQESKEHLESVKHSSEKQMAQLEELYSKKIEDVKLQYKQQAETEIKAYSDQLKSEKEQAKLGLQVVVDKLEEAKAQSKIELQNISDALQAAKERADAEVREIEQEAEERFSGVKSVLMEDVYFPTLAHNIPSSQLKNDLKLLELEIASLVKNNKAYMETEEAYQYTKRHRINHLWQLQCSFEQTVAMAIGNLSLKNFDACIGKVSTAYQNLNAKFAMDGVQISDDYLSLRLKELSTHYEMIAQQINETASRREVREKLLEEEKLRKEVEIERARIYKERRHFQNEIDRLHAYMAQAKSESQINIYADKIRELEEELKGLKKREEMVDSRERLTRSGYVYIISNVGAFGEGVYKIGLTRRLNPMERIKELGDASVPFPFDVHALIFSDDAPDLEAKLHQTFKNCRVNMANNQKEFFRVSLESIKQTVWDTFGTSVPFTDAPNAEEYFATQKMREREDRI